MEHSNDYFLALLIGYGTIGLVFGLANIFSVKSDKRKPIIEIYISLIMASILGALAFVTYINLKESESIVQSNQEMSIKIRKLADETDKIAIEALNMSQKTQHMAQETRDLAEQTKKIISETNTSIKKTKTIAETTRKIAEETKTIADISLNQFRLQSYPTFLVEMDAPNIENGNKYQSIRIRNEGEITASSVSILYVEVFKTNGDALYFHNVKESKYTKLMKNNTEEVGVTKHLSGLNPLDFLVQLPGHTSIALSSTLKDQGRLALEKLQYCIIFLKFKVPYDKTHRYETFAYNLMKEKVINAQNENTKWKYTWKVLNAEKKASILKRYEDTLSDSKLNKFLSDYGE